MDETKAALRAAARQVIEGKGCTLWRDWDVQNNNGMEQALDWAVEFVLEVLDAEAAARPT